MIQVVDYLSLLTKDKENMSRQLELDPAYYALSMFQNLLRDTIIPTYRTPFICSIFSKIKVSHQEFQALSQLERILINIHASFHEKVEKSSGKKLSFDISQAGKIMHTCAELEARQQAAQKIVNALSLVLSNSVIKASRTSLNLLVISIATTHNIQVEIPKLTV